MTRSDPELIVELISTALGHQNREKKIFLHEPDFNDSNANLYVNSCINTGWVSTAGEFVSRFETKLASFTGANKAVAVTNGTVALRLALYLVGVRNGDEVLVPPLSFVATCNAISHLGAFPHFIDIDKKNLGMDPICLDNHLNHICDYKNGFLINKKTGRRISAICPVHVFGNPANCIELKKISDKWSIPMVEDAAEALGSYISDKHCGLIGDIGILSFNGNKIITTGGGGALITNDVKIAERAKHISNTAKLSHKWEYFHDQVGWNDRMPNINAALGLAQLEKISEKIKLKKLLLERYLNVFEPLNNVKVFQDEDLMKKSNNWMISLLFEHNDKDTLDNYREEILKISHKKEIFLRPAWKLLSDLPMYISSPRSSLKNASNLVRRLINIPSSPQLMNNFNH